MSDLPIYQLTNFTIIAELDRLASTAGVTSETNLNRLTYWEGSA